MPRLADLRDASEAESGGGETLPTGLICMWSGYLADIPTGWALCDGQLGRPDLRGKFIKGTAAGIEPGQVGGAATHSHDDHPALTHIGAAVAAYLAHSVTQPSAHAAQDHSEASNEPVYYELAFIIKE